MNHRSEPNIRKARKNHRCNWCGCIIRPGEKYATTFIVCEGEAWRSKLHLECQAAEDAFDFDGEVLYYMGQFQRGHNHEPNWSTLADGVAHGCPACIKQSTQETPPCPSPHSSEAPPSLASHSAPQPSDP